MTRAAEGMKPLEAAIIQRWLAREKPEGEQLWNVRLFAPDPEWPAHYTPRDKEEWRWLTAKRVDLIVRGALGDLIVEASPRMSPRVLGELLMYREMWEAAGAKGRPVGLLLVTEVLDPALEPLFAAQGVRVQVV